MHLSKYGLILFAAASNAAVNETAKMWPLSENEQFSYTLNSNVANANSGGASSGEVMRIAATIKAGDFQSWHNSFMSMADKVHEMAVSQEKKGFLVSARDAYFRSASYYRAADFYLHGNVSDPRIKDLWEKQAADYTKAVSLLQNPAKRLLLKAKGFQVPAIWFPASSDLPAEKNSRGRRLPTLIVGTGYDGSMESLFHRSCAEVIKRGWNCITFEGPGQPTVRRQQEIGFIPEWWEAVTPVVNYVRSRKDVDKDKVALIGYSFGGQLAPLAATKEHRLAAVVCINGMMDLQRDFIDNMPPEVMEAFKSGNAEFFNQIVGAGLASGQLPTKFQWAFEHGMYAWNIQDPYKWLVDVGRFALDEQKLKEIQCPVYVASAEHDRFAQGQPEEMAKLLGDKGYYELFETDLGAGEHVSNGAEALVAMRTLEWLSGVFAKGKKQ